MIGRRCLIVLDTHVWIWWTIDPGKLTQTQRAKIAASEEAGIGISAMSCWEIAKLTELGRLALPVGLSEWFEVALGYPGVGLLELTPEVAVESASLPGAFHRDPADQVIVATARVHGCPLVTSDRDINAYPHVQTVR